MKTNFTLFLCFAGLHITFAQYKFISPVPGSQYHNPQTNIILKNGDFIDHSSLENKDLLTIVGSISGNHTWTARLSDDNKTVVIKPNPIFSYGEKVTVTVNSELRKNDGERINGTSFDFQIRKEITSGEKKLYEKTRLENFIESFGYDPTKEGPPTDDYPL